MADLFPISEVDKRITSNVIFLHGLGGHPFKTWHSLLDSNVCWLKWLDEDIEEQAIWTIGYTASVSRWRGSSMHLTDCATNVLQRILLEHRLKTGGITLIGHSLGGLVIKQLLRTAESMSHQNSEAAEFIKRVRRVAFLATPHSGAEASTWGDRFRIFIWPSSATAALVRNDPNLRELNQWYREWSVRYGIEHLILCENKPIYRMFVVVKSDSSDPGLPDRPIPIDADHFTICKPKDRASDIYLLISNFIKQPIKTKPSNEVSDKLKEQSAHIKNLISATEKSSSNIEKEFYFLRQSIAEQPEKFADLFADKLLTEGFLSNASLKNRYPREIIDSEIEKEISILRRARFFVEFKSIEYSIRLAEKIISGELEGGSEHVKSKALAWCARLLAYSEYGDKSVDYLRIAKNMDDRVEIHLAEAFIISAKGDLKGALSSLEGLDSPAVLAASLFIVNHHNDSVATIKWIENSGITVSELDAEGKFFYLLKLLEINRWDQVFGLIATISKKDFQQVPAIFQISAIAYLLQVIPEEFRNFVVGQVPLEAETFPLASNETSLVSRRNAQELFMQYAHAAQELGCHQSANLADDYALWLELRDPDNHESGRQKLQKSMRDPSHSLRRLNLALKFGLNLDIDAVEQEIERQTALSGGSSRDAAWARFSLAFTKESPKAVCDYIERHRTQLQDHFGKKSISLLELEALAKAGQHQQAEQLLAECEKDGLSKAEYTFLKSIIAESMGDIDPVEAHKSQFELTNNLSDLVILVNLLEEQKAWPQLCHFAILLFDKTKALPDAERYARALYETSQYNCLVEFLERYPEFLVHSDNIQMIWSWSLYFEGLLKESAIALEVLTKKRDHPNDRSLRVNLAISTGAWETLLSYVEEEWGRREERNAAELIQTAQLAQQVGSPRAEKLVYASVKDTNDPTILSTAYFLATKAGWEDDDTVAQWLHKAAELSDENGPLQKVSLKDLLDQKSGWDRRQEDTWQQLNDGNLPIFGAATYLNRSLVDMILFPALGNPIEQDPRCRSIIPAYSGVRQEGSHNYQVVAIEATALLTLGVLGLLDVVVDNFEYIVIPHTTLGWLFEEKQKITFHQPSKIKDAHKLRQLLANDGLKKFAANTQLDVDLAAEVGEELASLILEAQRSSIDNDIQKLVVRSSPVHRVGSLMEEEADISSYSAHICSCLSVVNKLKQKGQLTTIEEDRARSYLSLHEKEWPHRVEINDGAELYLDDLSVIYLQHIGILEKLQFAGFEVYISARKTDEVNALIRYEQQSKEVDKRIEEIRNFLQTGIENDKIKVARIPQFDKSDDSILLNHPTFAILELAKDVEAIIADDRFINQHSNAETGSGFTPIMTSLDLIDELHSRGKISFNQLLDFRTKLRQASYLFVPLSKTELIHHLNAANVVDNHINETAELKAIRENLLKVRMSNYLKLPKEALWLHNIMQVLQGTLKAQWMGECDEKTASVRSKWLIDQLDIRGWAHCLKGEGAVNIVKYGYGAQIMSLLMVSEKIHAELKDKYWSLVEEYLLDNIRDEEPELYSWIIDNVQKLIFRTIESDVKREQ